MDARQILLNLAIAGKAAGVVQPGLNFSEDEGRQPGSFAQGFLDGQQRPEPFLLIELEPRLDDMPMYGQQLGERQTEERLPAG